MKKGEEKQPLPKWAGPAFWLALCAAFFLMAFLMPTVYWYNASRVETQYYQYYTAFGKDVLGLGAMAARYDVVPMGNFTFAAKARSAYGYAQKAEQVLTTWNYTGFFIRQNEAALKGLGINAAGAADAIGANQSAVKDNARRMAGELEAFAAGDPQKQGEMAPALGELKRVSGGS